MLPWRSLNDSEGIKCRKNVHGNDLHKNISANFDELELPKWKELLQNVNKMKEKYKNKVDDDGETFKSESDSIFIVRESQTSEQNPILLKRPLHNWQCTVGLRDY